MFSMWGGFKCLWLNLFNRIDSFLEFILVVHIFFQEFVYFQNLQICYLKVFIIFSYLISGVSHFHSQYYFSVCVWYLCFYHVLSCHKCANFISIFKELSFGFAGIFHCIFVFHLILLSSWFHIWFIPITFFLSSWNGYLFSTFFHSEWNH